MKTLYAPAVALAAAMALGGAAHAQGNQEPTSPAVTPAVPVTEGAAPSGYAWAGGWFSNHYSGGYAGVLKALNADKSLYDDGFAVRGDISGGSYTYNAPGFVDRSVNVVDADVMAGYRHSTGIGNFSGYVGLAYVDHDNPDPSAQLRGSKTGLGLIGEYQNNPDKDTQVYVQARYASPFETWSGSARVLWKVTEKVWVGPQVAVYRNKTYDEVSGGPFLKVDTGRGELGFSAGYRHPTKSGNADGYYATAYFALPLR
jgi:hypothetical protein